MNQAEIWIIDLRPTVGAEMRKIRPAVIVNDDAIGILPLRVVVPVTGWRDAFQGAPWMVKLTPNETNNLEKVSAVDCFQIRSVSTGRFIRRTGAVSTADLEKIKTAVKAVLDAD